MTWRDRPYSGESPYQPTMQLRLRMPRTAVAWLVIANVAIHFVNILSTRWWAGGLTDIGGLSLDGITNMYLWQPVTYMFLHSTVNIFHLVINMLLLYFVGINIEHAFGRTRFLQFYGICGIIGGLAYLGFSLIDRSHFYVPLVGASGAVYGLLMAAMIFFPSMQIVFFVFPMPIRVFGLLLAAILLFKAVSPGGVDNLGGEVCHVAGALAAILIFNAWGIMPRVQLGFNLPRFPFGRDRSEGAWTRRQQKLAEEQAEVDRILAKVHEQGLASLSRKEKKVLAQATRRQQRREENQQRQL